MRKAKKEEKKQDSMVIELTDDVRINEDTILEAGDKIEILSKEKVEEEKLKESDYKDVLPEFSAMVASAKQKGYQYLANDLQELFLRIERQNLETGEWTEVANMFRALMETLDPWT